MTIPFFKSHYSIGKSILTLAAKDSSIKSGPQSIIDLCKKNKIKDIHLVDDSMSGFLEGHLNAKEAKLNLRFGLRISVCDDLNEKNEEEIKKTSKLILFANNEKGYKRLIKIYTKAAQEGFYYTPRTDYKSLKELWNKKDLTMVVPFYDSFLHKNTLHGTTCAPDLSFCKPLFAVEENDVPFNYLIRNAVENYCDKKQTLKVKSVFYNKKEDFKAYLTFRCINNRSTLERPNLDHMTSDEFCLESWKETK